MTHASRFAKIIIIFPYYDACVTTVAKMMVILSNHDAYGRRCRMRHQSAIFHITPRKEIAGISDDTTYRARLLPYLYSQVSIPVVLIWRLARTSRLPWCVSLGRPVAKQNQKARRNPALTTHNFAIKTPLSCGGAHTHHTPVVRPCGTRTTLLPVTIARTFRIKPP